ncbi:unnamed protein product, partial [Ilex paraguariensis]
MVHTLFEWRYGGHQVSLCGSFSGWTEIPMILLEGSSMVFQIICDLPLGYHQYRFLVDGVWRFNDSDQGCCIQDEYGTINNIILVKSSSSNGPLPEPVPRPSDNEIDVSRHRLFRHLSSYTTYELIPNSGKVFGLDVESAMKYAFHVMYEE